MVNGLALAGQIIVFRIVLVKHCSRDVRDIASGVRLASDVHLAVLQTERVDEVLEEAEELSSDFLLARSRGGALGEARADGLLDPDHVGEVGPVPWVVNGARAAAVLP